MAAYKKEFADSIYMVRDELQHFLSHHPELDDDVCVVNIGRAVDKLISDWRLHTRQDED